MAHGRPGVTGAVAGRAAERGPTRRHLYLDNLKVVLIAAIIALHAVAGYAGLMEVWTYSELREATLSPVTEVGLVILVVPFGLCLIALLFLVSGLLSAPSIDRKGPAAFARDRLVRLGIPFLVYVLVIQPTVVYALAHPLGRMPGSYWAEFLGEEHRLDTGPLWFVGVLLVFSLVYAGWVRVRRERRRHPGRTIGVRHLAVAAGLVASASFVVRLVYPYGSEAGFTDLNLWQWPACVAVFTVGVTAARQGWTDIVPGGLARSCREVALVAVTAMAGLLAVTGFADRVDDMMGGPTLLAAAFAALDAVLCMFGSVWLLSVAQRRLSRPLPHGRPMARSAYGAFIVQTPVLIGLALALRPLGLAAEVKALVLAGTGVAASYALAWLLVTRVPGLRRIL